MGNYNCQECVAKEVNFLNELLLDNSLFSTEDSKDENKIYESKIKNLKNFKPNKEDIQKLMESRDLSEEQKKFVEKKGYFVIVL